MSDASERFSLRQLPLPAKLVLSVFLLSVGLGYFSALVQLHFKQADAGSFMPTPKNVIRTYHGEVPEMRLKTLLVAPEDLPFSGSGSMRKAFTTKSEGWKEEVAARGENLLRTERDGEILVLLAWLNAEPVARREAYEKDLSPIPAGVSSLTAEFKADEGAKVKSIIASRCLSCHGPDGAQSNFPLDSYDKLAKYMSVEPAGRIDSAKLAQSTHAHLLSFSMLFTLTGLVFALTSYPVWLRCLLAPTVLLAQVADVACWWLARIEGPTGEMFALAILFTGGTVGMGVLAQIVLSLFNMYGAGGRAVLVSLFLAAGAGAFVGKTKFLDKYLEEEKKAAQLADAPGEKAEKKD